ncbi:Uncharacterised protein [Porphyromonas macacae]|uniref:Lipoprotein n=1 Tax=Porphyromonas macacae TaxID=28115 RepID=A0A379EB32_9PORP|nr:hypothetical protein [Porphyromonas macacae]SUB89887.1 Uncharacterised protein [Porphyromonas macacae]
MKRITIVFLLLCLLQTAGCAQPMSKQPVKKDTIMQQSREVERYDFEATKNGTEAVVIEQDGWIIEKSSMWPSGPFYNEYAPAKDFYEIQKLFYPSGIMRTKTAFLGNVVIGIREEYDREGNLIKVVDEDRKFGKIKPRDIVELLEKEGWFNRETGENRITEEAILPTTGAFYRAIIKHLDIIYILPERSRTGRSYWHIEIEPRFFGYVTTYIIDGETGEFSKEKKFVMKYE